MLQSFKNFISEHSLFDKKDKLLLALSGGSDSVCLFHLMIEGGYQFGVAHCNYRLRGAESDGDEQFIIQLATENNIPYHTIAFDTQTISIEEKTGIQETARKLRYRWFRELIKEHHYSKILTAHHQTDNLETMLINILRNTGIKGLHGIPMDENQIARPLLFTNREVIERYLLEKNLKFREDRSNSSNDYLRNELRHLVLPGIKRIQADSEQCFFETARKVKSYEDISNELIIKQWKEITTNEGILVKISKDKLNLIENKIPFLYYNLQNHGFSYSEIENILQAKQIGKKVMSGSHELTLERDFYLLQPIHEAKSGEEALVYRLPANLIIHNQVLTFELIRNIGTHDFKQKGRLYLAADKIDFPLRVRVWKEGDKLKPLGMRGYKKVSDILTDRKIENNRRKHILIIEKSDNEIIAILPDLIHNDYKVNPDTGSIVAIGINIVAP